MTQENNRHLHKTDFFILAFILILAFAFRLYKINSPLADFHSFRQADTAAVARNFVRDGFDLFHPHYDDFSNVQSGKENPQGYRFVEFPIYNAVIGLVNKAVPILPIEIWGRIITILSSLSIIAVIYYFLVKEYSRTAAVIGAVLYAVFPFFVFWSRVVLPDMNALAAVFVSLFFLYRFTEDHAKKPRYLAFILSILFFASALLMKPTAVFYGIPLLYLFFKKYSFKMYKSAYFYLFFLISVIPFLAWRKYILNFPEGIPASAWLITSINTSTGVQNIFFRPTFFRWVFYERISNLIVGPYNLVMLLIGLLVRPSRYFLHSIVVGAFVYLFVFQGGNIQHAYYQIMILPALAIAVGLGGAFLIEQRSLFISKTGVYILLAFCAGFSFLTTYQQVKEFYNYPGDLVKAAQVLHDNTRREDKVVTDTVGDTTLLYLADRKGSPSVYISLPDLKAKGYRYFLTFKKDVAAQVQLETDFKVVVDDEQFTLFKL